MGVVILLGIIALITLTVVNGSIKKSEQILYNTQINNITDGAKNWSADNIKSLPDEGEVYLTLAQLKQGGYVEDNIKSPANDKKCFPNDLEIKITITESGNYKYSIATDKDSINYISCDNEQLDINSPGIVLTKNENSKINKSNEVVDYVEVDKTNNNGNGYQVLAHNFYNHEGKKIDKSEYENYDISITIKSTKVTDLENITEVTDLENIRVNISNYGVTYKIVYTITENDKTVSAVRNVIVQDTTKPIITLTGVTDEETGETVTRTRYIYTVDGEYQPISNWCNISVNDNSNDTEINGNLSVTKSDNCSEEITKPGTYNVTVTAIDKSGNKQKKVYKYEFKEKALAGPLVVYNVDNNLPNATWTANNQLSINYIYGDVCTSGIKTDDTYITIGDTKYYGTPGTDSNGVYNVKYTLPDGVYDVDSINIHATCDNGRSTDEVIDDQIYKIDTTKPTYTSVLVKNITTTGYDVYVYGVSDNNGSGINRVQFPTWTGSVPTTEADQDDIQPEWWTNQSASGQYNQTEDTWVYHVDNAEHNYEYGTYFTDIYIYDNVGNSVRIEDRTIVEVDPVVITYNPNYTGSTNITVTQGAGSEIEFPKDPTRDGYTFAGWYDAGTGGNKIESTSTTPTANITYYAHWTANTYTVTYNNNYLKDNLWNETDNLSKYKNAGTDVSSKVLEENTDAKGGYNVVYTMNSGSSGGPYYYESGLTVGNTYTWSVYVKASSTKMLYIGSEQEGRKYVTVTTEWQKITHTFTAADTTYSAFVFYLSGDTWNEGDKLYIHSLEIEEGDGSQNKTSVEREFNTTYNTASEPLPTPAREGYKFVGWYKDEALTEQVTSTTTVTTPNDHTLYAKWTPNTYEVQYNPNGGSGSMSNSSHTYDKSSNLTANGFTKTGYTFAGWAITSGGDVKYSDSQSVKNLTTTAGGKVQLYAKWTANTYTVTYDCSTNGGTGNTSSTIAYGSSIDLTKTCTKSGWTFKGWGSNTDDKTALTSLTMEDKNTTLYAIYSKNLTGTFTVQDTNAATTSATSSSCTLYNNATECTITAPRLTAKTGYTAIGWNTNKSATTSELNSGASTTISSNITYYSITKNNTALTAQFNYYYGSSKSVSCYKYNGATSCSVTSPTLNSQTVDGVTYTARGYSTSNAANATINVNSNASVTLSSNVTYYASYQASMSATFVYCTLTASDYVYTNASQATTTASALRYMNYQGSFVHSNYTVPAIVTSSTGGASAQNYIGVSTSADSATVVATPTTANTKFYAVYTEPLTVYYYNSGHKSTTLTRRMLSNGSTYSNSLNGAVTASAYDSASFVAWTYHPNYYDSSYRRSPLATGANTLYAIYQKTVKVTYNANGGTGAPSASSGTKTYISKSGGVNTFNATITLSSTTPTKTGYTFAGWYKETGCTNKLGDAGAKVSVSSNITAYAKWEDKTAPTVFSVSANPSGWTSGNVTLTGKAQDTGSGVVAYQFSTSDSLTASSSGWTTVSTTTSQLTHTYTATTNGTYYYYAKDAVGNISKSSVVVANIDKTTPTMSISVVKSGTSTSVSSGTWVNTNLTVKLTKVKVGSSGATIYYCTDTANTCTPTTVYSSALTISTTGTSYIRYKITSGAGLSSSVGSYTAKIDKTGPVITFTKENVYPQRKRFFTKVYNGGSSGGCFKQFLVYDSTGTKIASSSVSSVNIIHCSASWYGNGKYVYIDTAATSCQGYGDSKSTSGKGVNFTSCNGAGSTYVHDSGFMISLNQKFSVYKWHTTTSGKYYFEDYCSYDDTNQNYPIPSSYTKNASFCSDTTFKSYVSSGKITASIGQSAFSSAPKANTQTTSTSVDFIEKKILNLSITYSDTGSGLNSDSRTSAINNVTANQTVSATDVAGNTAICTYNYSAGTCSCTAGTCK